MWSMDKASRPHVRKNKKHKPDARAKVTPSFADGSGVLQHKPDAPAKEGVTFARASGLYQRTTMSRETWTILNDAQLLAQCEVDTYRASGPGGQKRNKTSSAVRIRHLPSGLIVIAEESRTQHENRAKALKRLRQAFFLKLREPIRTEPLDSVTQREELASVRSLSGKLEVGRKDPRYWPVVGLILDVLEATEARVSETAAALGISTGHLIDFVE